MTPRGFPSRAAWAAAVCAACLNPVLASAQTVPKANLIKVAKADGFCAQRDEGICLEWRFERTPQLRLVADGDEDGMDYALQERGADGSYRYVLRFYPVLRDPVHRGAYIGVAARDITDIVLVPGEGPLRLQAGFAHDYQDIGAIEDQPWQKRVPVLLVVGKATQPDWKVAVRDFRASTVAALANAVRSAGQAAP